MVGVPRPHQSYGFVAFDVDPDRPAGATSMAATYYAPSTDGLGGDEAGRHVHIDAATHRPLIPLLVVDIGDKPSIGGERHGARQFSRTAALQHTLVALPSSRPLMSIP